MEKLGLERRTGPLPLLTSPSGLSLVEVMVAIVVLAITSVAMTSTGISVITTNTLSRRTAIAATLAQDQLEALKNLPMSAPQLTAGTHQDLNNPITATGGTGAPTPGPGRSPPILL